MNSSVSESPLIEGTVIKKKTKGLQDFLSIFRPKSSIPLDPTDTITTGEYMNLEDSVSAMDKLHSEKKTNTGSQSLHSSSSIPPTSSSSISSIAYCSQCRAGLQIPSTANKFSCPFCKTITTRARSTTLQPEPAITYRKFVCGGCRRIIKYQPVSEYIACPCGVVNYIKAVR